MPVSVPRCRRSVAAVLRRRGVTGDLLDTAALLVTELAGNAVEHVGGGGDTSAAFTVVLARRGRRLRIEVSDTGRPLPAGPAPSVPGPSATAGRGLFLVEALSFRWGTSPAAGGKAVWCELAC